MQGDLHEPTAGRPLRVGFIIDMLRPGAGTENQLLLLLRSFDRRRLVPCVCCLRCDVGECHLEHHDPYEVLNVTKLASLGGIRGVVRTRNWIRDRRLDLVVTFFRDANLVGTMGARLAGVPVVSSRRNLGAGYWHTPRELRMLRLINRLAAAYVANSEAIRDYTIRAEGVMPEAITVIPNAVDLERFHPSAEESSTALRLRLRLPDEFLIGCVANLRPIKGQDVLLQGLGTSDLLRRHCRLLLVGSGSQEDVLRQMAAELDITDRVIFLGSRKDVPEILRALDVAVLCSDAESSPNAILEYMATGLPIVATSVGGVPELLNPGTSGILVNPRRPDELARAIETLYASPVRRTEIGQEARRRAEAEFSPDRVVGCWMRFLEQTHRLHGPGSGRGRKSGCSTP